MAEYPSKFNDYKRDGQSLASERIGDPRAAQLSSVQEIYGRGQSWRLSQAWLKKGFIDNTLTFKISEWVCQKILMLPSVNFRI